jgi:hypothetical protein
MSAVLPEYAGLWNRLLLYRPGSALGAKAGPASWLDSALNRLVSSSLPLMASVIFGSATVFLRGLFGGLACWRCRQARADWLFPALVLGLFVVVPNVLNGVEAQRIRYSVEPMLFIAVLAGLRRNPRP